jgi:hypothetical protein
MHEIEAETRFLMLDRLVPVLFSVVSAVLTMALVASAIAPTFSSFSQALQRVAVLPH